MHTGTVRWFNDAKGYGVIDSEGKDVWVHYTQIQMEGFKTLAQGDRVEFDLYESAKGHDARNVKKLN